MQPIQSKQLDQNQQHKQTLQNRQQAVQNQVKQQPSQTNQQQAKRYLEVSPEDEARIREYVERNKTPELKIDEYHLVIAEFGSYYGWGGVQAILNNEIDSETMTWLLLAGRKIRSRNTYDMTAATFMGNAAANAGKKASSTFDKLTKQLTKDSKPDYE